MPPISFPNGEYSSAPGLRTREEWVRLQSLAVYINVIIPGIFVYRNRLGINAKFCSAGGIYSARGVKGFFNFVALPGD